MHKALTHDPLKEIRRKNPLKSVESTEEQKYQRGKERPMEITMPKLLHKP
jgi:hypothetical protein